MSRLISDKYREYQQTCQNRFDTLKANEEELNRIFIDIYGLQEELTPDVADKDVTVYRIIDEPSDEERKMRYVLSMRDEIVSLLSYIVGCILGRYSPYVDGLLFAGGEWDDAQIRARIEEGAKACDFADPSLGLFYPDSDGIVPITDEAYFPDDIAERTVEFIRKVYGEETLEENLAFVASALGGRGETPREVIRNYYLNDFYADHLKTYQKRPIYWLCDSGKAGAFRALFCTAMTAIPSGASAWIMCMNCRIACACSSTTRAARRRAARGAPRRRRASAHRSWKSSSSSWGSMRNRCIISRICASRSTLTTA